MIAWQLYFSMLMFTGLIKLLICNISSLGMIIIMYSPEFALGKSQIPCSMALLSVVVQDAYSMANVKWRDGTGNEHLFACVTSTSEQHQDCLLVISS